MDNMTFRYDIEGLAEDMGVDLNTISNLYAEYFLEMRSNIQGSRELCNIKNLDKLERVIHNIKGISVSLNIDDIFAAANKLDVNLKQGYFDTAESELNNIIKLFNAAEEDIKEFFKQNAIKLY